jgi:hypothetical protein
VIRQFVERRFEVQGREGEPGTITVAA